MATVKREFLLANRPVTPGDGRQRYEVNMHVDGNRERSVLMVDARDAVDTLEAIRAVYGLGQEDTAQTPETAAEAPEVKPVPVSYPDDDEQPQPPVHIRLLGREDTPYRIGLGRWVDVIHAANGLWPEMFGAAESEGGGARSITTPGLCSRRTRRHPSPPRRSEATGRCGQPPRSSASR